MALAPIAVFCYRRLNVLKQTMRALGKNHLADKSDLFIFSDGAKSEEDAKDVQKVRDYIKTVKGFKSITIIEAAKNKGLSPSIIGGVTELVNKYGKVIVIEDDIYTSPYFLKYMNDALEMYKDDEDVATISGYRYPIKTKEETFFLKKIEPWGWGTWKRSWKNFESDGETLLKEITEKGLMDEFTFNGTSGYDDMLNYHIQGLCDAWDVRWYASCVLKNKLSLYPGKTLTKNIGFGVFGSIHCKTRTHSYDSKLCNREIKLKRIPLRENKDIRKQYEVFFDSLKTTGNFFIKKTRRHKERTITILNLFKFTYHKK